MEACTVSYFQISFDNGALNIMRHVKARQFSVPPVKSQLGAVSSSATLILLQRVLVTTHIRDRSADTICAQLAVRTHQDGLWTAVQLFAY